jgi:hypothetical protein
MSIPSDISDEEMLARLAACDLSAAERVHGKLMAAEEVSEIAELGRTYQRFARSLRQTLALKARFKREQEQAAKEGQPAPPPPGGVIIARRVREVRAAVLRVIWNEAETEDERDDFEEALDDLIAAERLGERFCAEPLDDQVARLCLSLELSPDGAEGWRDLPDPGRADDEADPPSDPDAEPVWRGSG